MLSVPSEVKNELAARTPTEWLRADREDRGKRPARQSVLPFGIVEVDSRLPGGGLDLGALHEIAGGGNGTIDGAQRSLLQA